MKKNTALYLKIASGVIIVIGIVLLVAGISAGSGVIGVGGVLAVIGVIAGNAGSDKDEKGGEKKPKKSRSSDDGDNGSSRQVIFPDEEKLLTLTATNDRSFLFRHKALVLHKGKVYSVMQLAENVPELEGMVDDDTYFVFLVTDYDEATDTQNFSFISDEDLSQAVVDKYIKYKR